MARWSRNGASDSKLYLAVSGTRSVGFRRSKGNAVRPRKNALPCLTPVSCQGGAVSGGAEGNFKTYGRRVERCGAKARPWGWKRAEMQT